MGEYATKGTDEAKIESMIKDEKKISPRFYSGWNPEDGASTMSYTVQTEEVSEDGTVSVVPRQETLTQLQYQKQKLFEHVKTEIDNLHGYTHDIIIDEALIKKYSIPTGTEWRIWPGSPNLQKEWFENKGWTTTEGMVVNENDGKYEATVPYGKILDNDGRWVDVSRNQIKQAVGWLLTSANMGTNHAFFSSLVFAFGDNPAKRNYAAAVYFFILAYSGRFPPNKKAAYARHFEQYRNRGWEIFQQQYNITPGAAPKSIVG